VIQVLSCLKTSGPVQVNSSLSHLQEVSIRFDLFMYLSLPLSSSNTRTMTVTVIGTDSSTEPSQHTISMSKSAELKHFIHGLGASCSLRDDETILIASVHLLVLCNYFMLSFDYILRGVKVGIIIFFFLLSLIID
jgi:hypothetical protein